MEQINSTTLALIVVLALATGYWASQYFSVYRRMRIRRRIACLFGKHTPGPVRPAVGGRNIQRCDWCDKVVREYEVTVGEARQKIRRIY